MTTVHEGSAVPRRRHSPDNFRRQRQVARNARLYQQLHDLVSAYTKAKPLSINVTVENLAIDSGFEPHDLAFLDVMLSGRRVTIVCVPYGLWRRPDRVTRLLDFRQRARRAGFTIVLVPQAIVERQPRLGNAAILGVSRRVHVDATQRMLVIAHLIERGDCALSELAALLDHRDPYGAILGLAAMGLVRIDLSRVISPSTLISLPDPREDPHRGRLGQQGGDA